MIFIALVSTHAGEEEFTRQFAYPVSANTASEASEKAKYELETDGYKDRGFFVGQVMSIVAYQEKIIKQFVNER